MLYIEELQYYPYCTSCGTVFTTQEEVNRLIFVSNNVSFCCYKCSQCKEDKIFINIKEEK